jgi:cobalt-zinc-cadmium efflux system membrane fusion protein
MAEMGKSRRILSLSAALVAGIVIASLAPQMAERVRQLFGHLPEPSVAAVRGQDLLQAQKANDNSESQQLKLTPEQIAAAGIEVRAIGNGVLARRVVVPGTIVPNADRVAHVSVKLFGTVAELRKRLGDTVAKDEVLAVLESREVADAKSEYLAARLTYQLQQDLFERDKTLWDKHISGEQQFIRSRNSVALARMRFDITRQKLVALGLDEGEIAALPNEPEASFRRQDVRSPIAGRVVERKVELGAAVGRDSLETELFVVMDLEQVWVELALSPADLPAIREGQSVTITARGVSETSEGKIVFISPMLEKDTRSARVVSELANSKRVWRPGSFVTATIAVEEQPVSLAVPTGAVQTVNGEPVVFVRTSNGFEKRPVVLGRRDARFTEVASGVEPGELVAVANTFALKAEALKGLAED